jgi:nucleoside-diphosphate-sugar epimerase
MYMLTRSGRKWDSGMMLPQGKGGMTIAVIRPALVYGPHGEEWTARFLKGIATGNLVRLGPAGQGKANLVYAGDLAIRMISLKRSDFVQRHLSRRA